MARNDDIVLNEREASVLGPLAEHRFLTLPQLAVLLGVTERTAMSRVRQLDRHRLLELRWIFSRLPASVAVTGRGLRGIGSPMKAPQTNLNEYRHGVGVGWLWLAARAGSFGELRSLTTDRRMQAADSGAVASGSEARWGVGLGLLGPHGHPKRHYPDLMMDMASGHRVAVELELTAKSARRMQRIMSAYASDARVDHVLYLTATASIAALVRDAARLAGIPERVHVQLLAPDAISGAAIGRVRAAGRSYGASRTGQVRRAGAAR